MKPFASVVAAFALAIAGSGCSNLPDQGTIDSCYLTVGLSHPRTDFKLGSLEGWQQAAHSGVTRSRDETFKRLSQRLLDTTGPGVAEGGFTEPEIDAYAKAARDLERFCKTSNAFEGEPAG